MRNAAILIATLLLMACVAFAQNSGYGGQTQTDQNSSQSMSSATTQNSGAQTLRGCLSKEGSDYFLTTLGANEERYQITGDTEKLAAHVGHEISVTGDVSTSPSQASSSGTGGSSGMMNSSTAGIISMEKFHHISTTCNPG